MIGSKRVVWTLGVLSLVLLLSACGDQVPATVSMPEPTTTGPTSAPEPTATEPTSTPEPVAPVASPTVASTEVSVTSQPTIPNPPDPSLEALIEQVKEDLAQRLSVPIDQIEVLEVEEVAWPDASLGCPQPGMMYDQMITPGYRVVLTAMADAYEYHTDRNEVVIACDTPIGLRPIPIPPKSADDRTPWQPIDDPTVISP